MKRYIAFRLTEARIFELCVANYNLANDSRISVELVVGNAVEFISVETEADMQALERLMVRYEGKWADELPPPTQFRNPMADVMPTINAGGNWKRDMTTGKVMML